MTRYLFVVLASLWLGGCSFYARGEDDYRTAVRGVLEQKRPDVEACYKQCYEADKNAQGKVVASFEVEPKTGTIVKPIVVTDQTTAPPALQQCVLASLNGLKLNPADERTGAATFTWDFSR